MAKFYGSVFAAAKSGTTPQTFPNGAYVSNKRRSTTEIFTMAAQASGSQLYIGTLPIGAVFESICLNPSATLGAATLSCGSEAAPAKYAAAATLTNADTETIRATSAGKSQAPLTAPEDVYLTTGAAALPGAGTLVVELRWKSVA